MSDETTSARLKRFTDGFTGGATKLVHMGRRRDLLDLASAKCTYVDTMQRSISCRDLRWTETSRKLTPRCLVYASDLTAFSA